MGKNQAPLPEYASKQMRILVDAKIRHGTARIDKLIQQINDIEEEFYRLTASLDDAGWRVKCDSTAA